MNYQVGTRGAFRFDHVTKHLQISPLEQELGQPSETGWMRTLWLADQPALVEFTAGQQGINVHTLSGTVDSTELLKVVQRMFSLDRDWDTFVKQTCEDSILAGALTRWAGLRPAVPPDPFETLCWGITSQHIGMASGNRLRRRLIERLGRTVDYEGKLFRVHPRAVDIAASGRSTLIELGYPSAKASYLFESASALATGKLDLLSLRNASPAEAEAELRRWKGIGPWTARFTLVRGIGHADVLPVDENRLCGSLIPFYGAPAADPTVVQHLARHWTGWRGWVAFFWRNVGHISGEVSCKCG